MNYLWGTERRFNAYSDYFRRRFGNRLQKLSIDAGFTCPNRDGNIGRGGCSYCNNDAFSPSYTAGCKPVSDQINEGIAFHKKRYRKVKEFLAYFQSYSNTYASLDELKTIYAPALNHPDIRGIIIGTRPDCVDDQILDYLRDLSRDRFLVVEYGIESVHDETLSLINRGHSYEVAEQAIINSAERGILVGGHLILGLPREKKEHWLTTINKMNQLPLHSLKFHQLQIISGTEMERQYQDAPDDFIHLELETYLQHMVDLVELLNPGIILERIAGEVNPHKVSNKGWGIRYDQVLSRFEKILEERNTWQGKKY